MFSVSNPSAAAALKCPKHWNKSWCEFAEKYASMYLPQKSSPSSSSKEDRVSFKTENTDKLQKEDYSRLYSLITPASNSTLTKFSKLALKTKQCPMTLSLALAHRWEAEFPNKQAQELSNKLYEQSLECSEYSDIFRTRYALLQYMYGDSNKAIQYLENALAADEQRERFRSLYWATIITKKLKQNEKSAQYMNELFSDFPLSYYTVLLKEESGIDPLKGLAAKIVSRPELKSSDEENFETMIMGLLSHPKASAQETRLFAYLVSKLDHTMSEESLMKLSKALDKKNLFRAKIFLLNAQLKTNSTGITKEWLKELYPRAYLSRTQALEKTLHPFIVLGFIRQESGFDPFAVSPAGARGLLQLMPRTAKWLNGKRKMQSLSDPNFNLSLGIKYIKKNLDRFDNTLIKAAAAYNGGYGWVRKWEKRYPTENNQLWADLIPFGETRNYIPSVAVNAYWYQKLYKEDSGKKLPVDISMLYSFLGDTSSSK